MFQSVNLSPFYPGRTIYGGASTYRKYSVGSNKSANSPSVFSPSLRRTSLCNRSKVNPSPTTLPKMSIVAENILKTIDAMTPVTLLMSMPRPEEVNPAPASLRGNGVKRKLPELQIPSVVNTKNLIQLKASDRKNVLSQSVNEPPSSSSSSGEELDYEIVSQDAKRSLKEKMKRPRVGNMRGEEVERNTEVKLPNAVLQVSTLPVFDIPLKSNSMEVSFSDPIDCRDINISSESSLLSISSSQEESEPKPRTSVTLPPVEVSPKLDQSARSLLNKSSESKPVAKTTHTWTCDICTHKHHTSDTICKSCNQPRFIKQVDSSTEKKDVSTPVSLPVSSTPATSTSTSTATPTPSLSESFKPAANTWECEACCVRNKPDVDACVCCTTQRPGAKPKSAAFPAGGAGFGDLSKPAVGGGFGDLTKPGATGGFGDVAKPAATGGFGDLFKKPSGSWECPSCMVSNKSADDKCVACESAKPGSKPAAPSNSLTGGTKFSFGIKPDAAAPAFKFGMDKVDAKTSSADTKPVTSAAPTFSFGMPAATSAQATPAATPTFSFGMPKAQDPSTEKKETPSKEEKPATPSVPTNPASSFTFKPSSPALDTKPTAAPAPVLNFTSPVSTPSSTTGSTPSFSFGTTNGPIPKLGSSATPAPAEPKAPEVSKPSLFGASAPSFLSSNASDTQKPLTSLFGLQAPSSALVNNSEANKAPVNSFGDMKAPISVTSNNTEQPPSKLIDFGKPAEAAKPLFGGASLFGGDKLKASNGNTAAAGFNFTAPSNSAAVNNTNSTAPPPAFPSKPDVFSFGSKPASNTFSAPSASVFKFGSSTQPSAQPSLGFGSPAPAAPFTFSATTNNTASGFQPPQQTPMFGNPAPATNVFGGGAPAFNNTAAAPAFNNTAQPAAPIFGGGFNQPATQPAPAAAPFQFGSNAGVGFSLGPQVIQF